MEKLETRAQKRARAIQSRQLKKELESQIHECRDQQEVDKTYAKNLICAPFDEFTHTTARHNRCRKGERLIYRTSLLRQI